MDRKQIFANEKDVWRVKELQQHLSIGQNSAYELVNSGKVHSIRIGHKIRIPKQSVIDFMLKSEYSGSCNDGFNPQSGKETIAL